MARELIFSVLPKDFEIQYFSGTGAGGQYRNKHQNCVRLHHKPSGALVTGQSNRERTSNIREAKENLKKNLKFKMWITRKIQEIKTGKTIDQRVDEMLDPKNLVSEVKEDGKWVKVL